MTPKVYNDVTRMRGYGWRWGMIASIINRQSILKYTPRQLESDYEATKAGKPFDLNPVARQKNI